MPNNLLGSASRTLLCLFAVLLSPCAILAQEIPESSLPAYARDGVVPPDRVLYRVFLHHLAAFEIAARANEAQGKDGDIYRRHFVIGYRLTPPEVSQLAEIALKHRDAEAVLKPQIEAAVTQWRSLNAPNGHRDPNGPKPARSAELIALEAQSKSLALAGRDQIHAALGDAHFAHLDAILRARAARDFPTLAKLTAGGTQ